MLLWAVSGQAGARERPRVVLLTSDPEGTTATRLNAELRSLGIEVVLSTVDDDAHPQGHALVRAAKAERAFAAVWLVSDASKTEAWIADRVRGKTLPREIVAEERDRDSRDDTIAVGTVEVLRVSLLAVSVEVQPRPSDRQLVTSDLPRPPAVKRLLRPLRRRRSALVPVPRNLFGVALGPAGDLGVGGVGLSLGAVLGLRWQSLGAWGIEALVSTTLRPAVVRSNVSVPAAGSEQSAVGDYAASANVFLYRGGLGITFSPFEGPLVPLVALGITLVRFEAKGHPATADAIVGVNDGTWATAPYLGYGLGYDLGKNLRVRTDMQLLVAPRCTVRFVSNEVVRWGEPAVMGSLALEILIPRPE